MIQVGIIGATGYAGGELVRLLYGHKDVEIKWYGSRSYVDQKYASVYQNMFQIVEDVCKDDNLKQLAKEVDVIFTATPQGFLAGVLDEEILSNTKVIDLSADFRIKDVATYEKWYGIEHKSPQFIPEAVYGLCERNREAIKQARLVANPGCYPTCSITSIFPLAAEGLIDMDTLKQVSEQNRQERLQLMRKAQDHLEPALCRCEQELARLSMDPAYAGMQARCEEISEQAYAFLIHRLQLNERERHILRKTIRASLFRLMREPFQAMKQLDPQEQEQYTDMLRKLFEGGGRA